MDTGPVPRHVHVQSGSCPWRERLVAPTCHLRMQKGFRFGRRLLCILFSDLWPYLTEC